MSRKDKKRKLAVVRLHTPVELDDELVAPEDILTTVDVLTTLANNPKELGEKYTKDVKRATFQLHRVIAEGATLGTSLSSKISAALQDYRFTDALVYLFEMYARKIQPKLGAVQRWVRECDATSGGDGSPGDAEALRCLDMILRIANQSSTDTTIAPGAIVRIRDRSSSEIDIWKMVCDGTLSPSAPSFRIVHRVPGPMRKPPNVYDSTVYTCDPGTIQASTSRPNPTRHDIPGVPGAFLVLDVFTPEECLQIVQAAVAMGFEKDEAAEGSARVKSSVCPSCVHPNPDTCPKFRLARRRHHKPWFLPTHPPPRPANGSSINRWQRRRSCPRHQC